MGRYLKKKQFKNMDTPELTRLPLNEMSRGDLDSLFREVSTIRREIKKEIHELDFMLREVQRKRTQV